jgi:hypothetical protein
MKPLKNFLYVSLALLVVVVAYLPGLHSGFLFDDHPHIVDNTALEIPKLSIANLYHASLSSNAGPLKRPVAMLTLAVNHYYSGHNPFDYIVTNIAIHLLAALGVLALAYLIATALGKHQKKRAIAPLHFALLAMLIWGLHPYNLTSVLYIIQRMTSLAGLFSILALVIFVFYRTRLSESPRNLFFMGFGVAVAGTLAIFSKENALLLPIQIAVLEWTIFATLANTPNYWLKLRKWILILGGTTIALFALEKLVMTDWVVSYQGRGFSLEERLLTEQRILLIYLRQIVLPDITSMGLFLDDLPISTSLLNPLTTILALALHIALILAALRYRVKQPVFSFAVLWFYSSHLLESTVFPLELMFEHRNYLAMIGPVIAIVYYASGIRIREQHRIAYAFICAFIGLLGVATAVRASYFGDPVAYALYEAEHHPKSSRANFYAGRTMSQMMLADAENKNFYFQKALNYYNKAEQANNQTIEPLIAESQTYLAAGKQINPTLLVSLQKKLSSAPPGNNGYYIAKGLLEIGRIGYPNKITKEQLDNIFTAALSNPKVQGDNRGHILIAYGMTYCNYLKMCDKAVLMTEQAVKSAPSYTEFKVILASLYGIVGDKSNAQKWTAIAEKEDKLKYFAEQIKALKSGAEITWGPQLPDYHLNEQSQHYPSGQK